MLIRSPRSSCCIVYAHGLGSNKLEALSITKYFIKHGFDMCSFDFSSSGRSQGEYTSYGMREQDDISAVLGHLDGHFRYERYILWGRSMGSVAIILNQGKCFNKKVICIVLDSPFSSFEKIAVQLASKKSFIPEFMLEILIQPLKSYFKLHHPVNPFEIDVCQHIQKIDTRILIVYSKNDTVVQHSHSIALSKLCKKNPLEVEIKEDHNMERSRSTHKKILVFIDQCIDEQERRVRMSQSKNRGISVTSKDEKR